MAILFGSLFVITLIAFVLLLFSLRSRISKYEALDKAHAALKERFIPVLDADAEKSRVLAEIEVEKQRFLVELEAEKHRVLDGLDVERARLQTDVLNADAEKQRMLAEVDARRERFLVELEAEKQRVLGGLEVERSRLQADIVRLQSDQSQSLLSLQEQQRRGELEMETLRLSIARLREEFNELDEEANLRSFGFYKPRYDFASSDRYQSVLEKLRESQKKMIKDKTAAICAIQWTVNGSLTEGRKQINQTLRLILRAFNGESDAAIAKVKYNNVNVMEARIRKAWEAINSLVGVQQCKIAEAYLNLKLEELLLVHEYLEKVQDEKEEQRRIREQMREEEIAMREAEKARLDAEKEERRYADALVKARAEVEQVEGEKQQKLLGKMEELQRRLEEAQANKERAIARAQMTRSGHVYIISNIGSFGEDVYKIGMTRRLDPMERVRELGDASVPFQFDVHAVIYSEDAPKLETTLHRIFHNRRINRLNERREFFRVTIDEIANAVRQHHGEIEITRDAEAKDYRKSLAMIREGQVIAPTMMSA